MSQRLSARAHKTCFSIASSHDCQNNNGYTALNGQGNTNDINTVHSIISESGTFKNLYAEFEAACGAGVTATIALRVNGVDSALSCTIGGAADTKGNNLITTVHVSAGDRVNIHVTRTAGLAASTYPQFAVTFVPDRGG